MKKVLMTLALALSMSAPAFAATTIGDWAVDGQTAEYAGTQASTAAAGLSANGVVFSRHNVSSYGEHYQMTTSTVGVDTKVTAIKPLSTISTEVCVFCHTPHFGQTNTAPLWNRGSSMAGYVAYGTTTANVAGTTLAGTATSVSGSSLACLSCHDGVTTFDNLINKPGKTSRTNGTGADLGWIMSEIGDTDVIGDTGSGGSDGTNTGLAGTGTFADKSASSRLNIGADNANSRTSTANLSNDHPIAVVYDTTGTKASLRLPTTTISGIVMTNARENYGDSLNASGLGYVAGEGTFGRSDNLWAVKGFISNSATIADLLRDGGQVACASCHDPHYKNQTNNDPAVVCSYLPSVANWNSNDEFYNGVAPYTDEVATPSAEGCLERATGIDKGVVSGSNPNPVGDGVAYADYVGAKDSDGLFLRRVGGNSNSGVCRTCHNK